MTGSVLVVEDEDPVREYITAGLRRHGFSVLGAANGADAVRIAQQHSGRIDVLLADIILPGMPGHEVAGVLRVQRPELRAVFISGYDKDALAGQGWLSEDMVFLAKPFTVESMVDAVRAALAG